MILGNHDDELANEIREGGQNLKNTLPNNVMLLEGAKFETA